jgi:hypothetical protein
LTITINNPEHFINGYDVHVVADLIRDEFGEDISQILLTVGNTTSEEATLEMTRALAIAYKFASKVLSETEDTQTILLKKANEVPPEEYEIAHNEQNNLITSINVFIGREPLDEDNDPDTSGAVPGAKPTPPKSPQGGAGQVPTPEIPPLSLLFGPDGTLPPHIVKALRNYRIRLLTDLGADDSELRKLKEYREYVREIEKQPKKKSGEKQKHDTKPAWTQQREILAEQMNRVMQYEAQIRAAFEKIKEEGVHSNNPSLVSRGDFLLNKVDQVKAGINIIARAKLVRKIVENLPQDLLWVMAYTREDIPSDGQVSTLTDDQLLKDLLRTPTSGESLYWIEVPEREARNREAVNFVNDFIYNVIHREDGTELDRTWDTGWGGVWLNIQRKYTIPAKGERVPLLFKHGSREKYRLDTRIPGYQRIGSTDVYQHSAATYSEVYDYDSSIRPGYWPAGLIVPGVGPIAHTVAARPDTGMTIGDGGIDMYYLTEMIGTVRAILTAGVLNHLNLEVPNRDVEGIVEAGLRELFLNYTGDKINQEGIDRLINAPRRRENDVIYLDTNPVFDIIVTRSMRDSFEKSIQNYQPLTKSMQFTIHQFNTAWKAATRTFDTEYKTFKDEFGTVPTQLTPTVMQRLYEWNVFWMNYFTLGESDRADLYADFARNSKNPDIKQILERTRTYLDEQHISQHCVFGQTWNYHHKGVYKQVWRASWSALTEELQLQTRSKQNMEWREDRGAFLDSRLQLVNTIMINQGSAALQEILPPPAVHENIRHPMRLLIDDGMLDIGDILNFYYCYESFRDLQQSYPEQDFADVWTVEKNDATRISFFGPHIRANSSRDLTVQIAGQTLLQGVLLENIDGMQYVKIDQALIPEGTALSIHSGAFDGNYHPTLESLKFDASNRALLPAGPFVIISTVGGKSDYVVVNPIPEGRSNRKNEGHLMINSMQLIYALHGDIHGFQYAHFLTDSQDAAAELNAILEAEERAAMERLDALTDKELYERFARGEKLDIHHLERAYRHASRVPQERGPGTYVLDAVEVPRAFGLLKPRIRQVVERVWEDPVTGEMYSQIRTNQMDRNAGFLEHAYDAAKFTGKLAIVGVYVAGREAFVRPLRRAIDTARLDYHANYAQAYKQDLNERYQRFNNLEGGFGLRGLGRLVYRRLSHGLGIPTIAEMGMRHSAN